MHLFTCLLPHLPKYESDILHIHLLGRLICLLSSSKCQPVMCSPKPKGTISSTDPVANSLTGVSTVSLGSFYSRFSFWTLTARITLASFLTS